MGQTGTVLPEDNQNKAEVTAGIGTRIAQTHHSRKEDIVSHDCQDIEKEGDKEGGKDTIQVDSNMCVCKFKGDAHRQHGAGCDNTPNTKCPTRETQQKQILGRVLTCCQ